MSRHLQMLLQIYPVGSPLARMKAAYYHLTLIDGDMSAAEIKSEIELAYEQAVEGKA